jgi:hypothetical protein
MCNWLNTNKKASIADAFLFVCHLPIYKVDTPGKLMFVTLVYNRKINT